MTNREKLWIRTENRLPDNDTEVLIIESDTVYQAFYQDGLFLTVGDQPTFTTEEIEYWFPVPELPEEE